MLRGTDSVFGVTGAHDALMQLLQQPAPFTWEHHGRAYLDGLAA